MVFLRFSKVFLGKDWKPKNNKKMKFKISKNKYKMSPMCFLLCFVKTPQTSNPFNDNGNSNIVIVIVLTVLVLTVPVLTVLEPVSLDPVRP